MSESEMRKYMAQTALQEALLFFVDIVVSPTQHIPRLPIHCLYPAKRLLYPLSSRPFRVAADTIIMPVFLHLSHWPCLRFHKPS